LRVLSHHVCTVASDTFVFDAQLHADGSPVV
jgi:hypothetical protein